MNEIKTLLWHLDALSASGRRLAAVQALARNLDARLEVLFAVTPLPLQFPFAMSIESSAAGQLEACATEVRRTARNAFQSACAAAGMVGPTWEESEDEPVSSLRRLAWAADLLVLAQHDPKADPPSGVPADFVASVLVSTGKPGLVLPYIDFGPTIGRNVLVAWKPTPESARALAAALPLLQRARRVHLVSWAEPGLPGDDGLETAQRFLHRHGVLATAHLEPSPGREVGEALLSKVADLQADLAVMGCYGHGRAREWALGGVTRTVLQSMTVPMLMVH